MDLPRELFYRLTKTPKDWMLWLWLSSRALWKSDPCWWLAKIMLELRVSMMIKEFLSRKQNPEMQFRSLEFRTSQLLEILSIKFPMKTRRNSSLPKENKWACKTSAKNNKKIQLKLLKLDWIIEAENLCTAQQPMMPGLPNSKKNKTKLIKK